ncbi:hypothetical protein [Waterburya agarophytonicola]|nr:hypothetical protein [Waterburya agarophytonicola]
MSRLVTIYLSVLNTVRKMNYGISYSLADRASNKFDFGSQMYDI